jgi:hypothetical protein
VLEAAWQAALDASDWAALGGDRLRLPDAVFAELLEGTLVARAAHRCYGAAPAERLARYCFELIHHLHCLLHCLKKRKFGAASPGIPAPEEAAALLKRLHERGMPGVFSDVLAAFDLGAAPAVRIVFLDCADCKEQCTDMACSCRRMRGRQSAPSARCGHALSINLHLVYLAHFMVKSTVAVARPPARARRNNPRAMHTHPSGCHTDASSQRMAAANCQCLPSSRHPSCLHAYSAALNWEKEYIHP